MTIMEEISEIERLEKLGDVPVDVPVVGDDGKDVSRPRIVNWWHAGIMFFLIAAFGWVGVLMLFIVIPLVNFWDDAGLDENGANL